jgi:hypothetical protein
MSKLAPARIVSIVLLIWAVSVGSVAGEGAKANCMSGDCNAGYGKMEWPEGRQKGVCPGISYEGYFKDGLPNGFGKLVYPCTGCIYFGEFKNGLEEGIGTLRWPSGEGYTGEWRNGSPAGAGFSHGKNGELTISHAESKPGLTLLRDGDVQREDIYSVHPTKVGPKNDIYIPKDLDSALEELKIALQPELLEKVKKGKEEDMIQYHFDLGLWLRNNWGLRRGSALANWFNAHGVKDPDNMSGVILTSLWRELNDKPLDLDTQLKEASK